MAAAVATIIQARLNSSRLPAKVMLSLAGKTLLQRVVERSRLARRAGQVWVATSDHPRDEVVAHEAARLEAPVHRGPLDDVLARFRGAAGAAGAEVVVRVTADNPLVEPRFIDLGVERLVDEGWDYLRFAKMPYGSGVEVFTARALARADQASQDPYEREHVCPHFYHNPQSFRVLVWDNPLEGARRPDMRVTLDDLVDFERLHRLFVHFAGREPVGLEEALAFLEGLPPDPGAVDR
jgi:spore coat polysaccharide biosynthesis protein SpsF